MLDSLESQIFSRIKANFSDKIKSKYPSLSFTTSNKSQASPKFPTVYIHFMESQETEETLDGTDVNAVTASFQVDVSDNQSQARADEVAREVLRIMKSMRFRASGMPFHDNSGDTYRTVSRYRRIIASGDIL